MADAPPPLLCIGIYSDVLAIDPATGEERWRTKVASSSFVTLHHAGDALYVGAAGQLFCLDAATGSIRWRNKLKGLGHGLVSFAGGGAAGVASDQAGSAAAMTASIAATAAAAAAIGAAS